MKEFRFNNPEHKIEFVDKVEGYDKVSGDFDRLLQAINNVLDNAAKFSLSSQTITVTLQSQPRD